MTEDVYCTSRKKNMLLHQDFFGVAMLGKFLWKSESLMKYKNKKQKQVVVENWFSKDGHGFKSHSGWI